MGPTVGLARSRFGENKPNPTKPTQTPQNHRPQAVLSDKYSKFDPQSGEPTHDKDGAELEGKVGGGRFLGGFSRGRPAARPGRRRRDSCAAHGPARTRAVPARWLGVGAKTCGALGHAWRVRTLARQPGPVRGLRKAHPLALEPPPRQARDKARKDLEKLRKAREPLTKRLAEDAGFLGQLREEVEVLTQQLAAL